MSQTSRGTSQVRRRVLMTADAVGGVWTYALDLASGLAERGDAVVLAVLGPAPNPEQREAASRVPGLALLETGLPLDWTASSPDAVTQAGQALAELARRSGVDLVHMNSPALAAEAHFGVPVIGVCHSCVATWWAAMRDGPLPAAFAWRTDLVARGYAACDALVAPSAAFAEATARTYGIPAPVVVHNGRSFPPFEPEEAGSEAYVFTAGRLWDEGKNVASLDRAASLIDLPVRAAGSLAGPNGARIAFSRIESLGHLSNEALAAHYAARPIFVSLSGYEPFGLAVLEAAASGCPLVLSDIATFRELWEGAASFVPPHDAEALAATLTRLGSDAAGRGRLGQAARERALRYTAERMVSGTVAVYDAVLQRPSRAPGSQSPQEAS